MLGIDNHPIGSSSDLVVALRQYKPNQSVGITYERDGGDQVALAILAEKLRAVIWPRSQARCSGERVWRRRMAQTVRAEAAAR